MQDCISSLCILDAIASLDLGYESKLGSKSEVKSVIQSVRNIPKHGAITERIARKLSIKAILITLSAIGSIYEGTAGRVYILNTHCIQNFLK